MAKRPSCSVKLTRSRTKRLNALLKSKRAKRRASRIKKLRKLLAACKRK